MIFSLSSREPCGSDSRACCSSVLFVSLPVGTSLKLFHICLAPRLPLWSRGLCFFAKMVLCLIFYLLYCNMFKEGVKK